MTNTLIAIYVLALSGLGLFGFLGYVTLWYFWRHHRDQPAAAPEPAGDAWPEVTVQLPIYNERYVVARLVEAAAGLEYPADRLQIQVIDDSTDDTTDLAGRLVAEYKARGVNIELVHRDHRHGFKAGALAAAIKEARGEYLAIFDADFQPQHSFLKQTIPLFVQEENLGMVQTRWGHLNDGRSPLTAAQAIAMDKHFVIEQTVRHRADFYPKFNGTAGVWRKTCVEDSGGWKDDTVCEDLCLSTRAILTGWDFQFLPDVVTPGELPTSISAYKSQQARWAKGSLQCLLKYGWEIFTDRQHSLIGRLYALIAMSGYLAHPLLLLIILAQVPLILLGYPLSSRLFLFSLLSLGQPILFIISQQLVYADWKRRLRHFPTLMLISLGLGPSISRGLIETFVSRTHAFVRTPKGDGVLSSSDGRSKGSGYLLPFDWIAFVELGLAIYGGAGLLLAIARGIYGPVFLLAFCLFGFGTIAWLTFREQRQKY